MRELDETPDDSADSIDSLPAWAVELLSKSMAAGTPRSTMGGATAARASAAIMERVRREPRPLRAASAVSPPMRASRWTRRGLLTPFGAAALAGMLGLVLSVRAVATLGGVRGASGMTMSAAVIGDTVMPSLSDTVSDTVRDTLRIVEFVLRGPAARGGMESAVQSAVRGAVQTAVRGAVRSVDVVGDFNAWRRGATAMAQRADGTWYVRVIVPQDVVRFAYAVNDERTDTPAASEPGSNRHAPPPVMRARIDSI